MRHDCLTCHYEPTWHKRHGICKLIDDPKDAVSLCKWTNPDEVQGDGAMIYDCLAWKPKTSEDMKKKKYKVLIKQIYTQPVEVLAHNPDEALDAVKNGNGKVVHNDLRYIDDAPTNTWVVLNV